MSKRRAVKCQPVDDDEYTCSCGQTLVSEAAFTDHGCKDKERGYNPYGKDWKGKCDNCGASPTVSATGLCGPCTWGESETVGGNW